MTCRKTNRMNRTATIRLTRILMLDLVRIIFPSFFLTNLFKKKSKFMSNSFMNQKNNINWLALNSYWFRSEWRRRVGRRNDFRRGIWSLARQRRVVWKELVRFGRGGCKSGQEEGSGGRRQTWLWTWDETEQILIEIIIIFSKKK